MKKQSIILKAKDFKYPSKKERKVIKVNIPKFTHFGFAYKSEIESIFDKKLSFEDASRIGNLHYWDNYLINRFGFIRETYNYALCNYKRGFKDDYNEFNDKEIINQLLFEYYSEILYYYFFSARDIIIQILNQYFNLGFTEEKIRFNSEFINRINDNRIKDLLHKFDKETQLAKKYRNKFTHRFPPNKMDNRSVICESNGKVSIGIGGGVKVTSSKIVENINDSLSALSSLMIELKKIVISE